MEERSENGTGIKMIDIKRERHKQFRNSLPETGTDREISEWHERSASCQDTF